MAEQYDYGGVDWPDPQWPDEPPPAPRPPPSPAPPPAAPAWPDAPGGGYGEPPGAWEEASYGGGGYGEPEGAWTETRYTPPPPPVARPEYVGVAGRPFATWQAPQPQIAAPTPPPAPRPEYQGIAGHPFGDWTQAPEEQAPAGGVVQPYQGRGTYQPGPGFTAEPGPYAPPPLSQPYAAAMPGLLAPVLRDVWARPQAYADLWRRYGPDVPGLAAQQAGRLAQQAAANVATPLGQGLLGPVLGGPPIASTLSNIQRGITQAQQGPVGQAIFGPPTPPEATPGSPTEAMLQAQARTNATVRQQWTNPAAIPPSLPITGPLSDPGFRAGLREIGPTLQAQGLLPGILTLANRPYEVGTEPFVAGLYAANRTPEQYVAKQAFEQQQAALRSQADQARRAGDAATAGRLYGQADEQRRAYYAANPAEQLRIGPNPYLVPYLSKLHYGTPEEIARYRGEVAPAEQLLYAAIADPLNLLDFGFGDLGTVYRGLRAADALQPWTKVVNGVAQQVTPAEVAALTEQRVKRLDGIARLSPFAPTRNMLADAAITNATDMTNNLVHAFAAVPGATAENWLDLLRRFIDNPLDPEVVKLSGGLSQSRKGLEAADFLKRTLGPVDEKVVQAATQRITKAQEVAQQAVRALDATKAEIAAREAAGQPVGKKLQKQLASREANAARLQQAATDAAAQAPKPGAAAFDDIIKAVKDVDSDAEGLHAVAELASRFEDSALATYGKQYTEKVGGKEVTRYAYTHDPIHSALGGINNFLSIAFMGTNPGYAIRNGANNFVTAIMDGVNPFHSVSWQRDFWTRWGVIPSAAFKGQGPAGDYWKAAQAADFAGHLEPMLFRNTFDAPGSKWHSKTLAFAQNLERYASQRIVEHHLAHYWGVVWPQTLKGHEQRLIAAGLRPEVAAAWRQAARDAMNQKELMAKVERLLAGAPVGLPDAVQEAATQIGGAQLAQHLDKLDTVVTSPQGKQAALATLQTIQDEAREVLAATDHLDEMMLRPPPVVPPLPPTALRDETLAHLRTYSGQLNDYFREMRAVETQFIAAHRKYTDQMWRATRNLDAMEADAVWQEYWERTQGNLRQFYDKLNATEASVGSQVGFSDEAIQRAQQYRRESVTAREAYIKALQDTWQQSREAKRAGDYNAADHVWQEFYKWADEHYATKATRDDVFLQRRITDINEAIVRGSQGAPPPTAGAVPEQPPGPTPVSPEPQAPPAAALEPLPDDRQLAELVAQRTGWRVVEQTPGKFTLYVPGFEDRPFPLDALSEEQKRAMWQSARAELGNAPPAEPPAAVPVAPQPKPGAPSAGAAPVQPAPSGELTITDFVRRMARGELLDDPAEIQFYENHADEIEAELRRIKQQPPSAKPPAESTMPTAPSAKAAPGGAPTYDMRELLGKLKIADEEAAYKWRKEVQLYTTRANNQATSKSDAIIEALKDEDFASLMYTDNFTARRISIDTDAFGNSVEVWQVKLDENRLDDAFATPIAKTPPSPSKTAPSPATSPTKPVVPSAAGSRYELYSMEANGKVDWAGEAAYRLGYAKRGSFFPYTDAEKGTTARSHIRNAWNRYVVDDAGNHFAPPRNNVEFAAFAEAHPAEMQKWIDYLRGKARERNVQLGTVESYIAAAPQRHARNIEMADEGARLPTEQPKPQSKQPSLTRPQAQTWQELTGAPLPPVPPYRRIPINQEIPFGYTRPQLMAPTAPPESVARALPPTPPEAAPRVAPPAPAAPAQVAREPWQMTKDELRAKWPRPIAGDEQAREPWMMPARDWNAYQAQIFGDAYREPSSETIRWHKGQVFKAISEGKPVPAAVLADYPDLAPRAAPVAEAAPAETADFQRQAAEYEAQRTAMNTQANEYTRLVKLGQEAVPGLRLADAEDAGRMAELHAAGKVTADEWQKYVGDLWNEYRINEKDRAAFLAKYPQFAPTEAIPAPAAVPAPAVEAPVAPVKPAGPVALGNPTIAQGINDPNQTYNFRYKVVSLDDLIPSHLDNLEPNPSFPAALQPRLRDRVGSQKQIDTIARTLNPDALLVDTRSLDRGSMIVGADNIVESGNGRTLALRKARAENLASWQTYGAQLRQSVQEYGINPDELARIPNPVLVRERVGDVANRAAFTAEANASQVLAMAPFEQALQDAKRIPDNLIATFSVGEQQSVEQALRSTANANIAKAFVGAIPANERAALLDAEGALNPAGIQRLKAALFAKTYPDAAGQRLTQTFTESLDPGIKQIEAGMFASLPRMGRAESLIRLGERDAGLSIADDLAAAVDMLARLKQEGMRVDDFLAQGALFERELTPFQEELLTHFNQISRSPKRVRELLNGYADGIIEAPAAAQMGFFGDEARPTKEGIYERIRQAQAANIENAGPLFAQEEAPATFGANRPRLEESPRAPKPGSVAQPGSPLDALRAIVQDETGSFSVATYADLLDRLRNHWQQPAAPLNITPEEAKLLRAYTRNAAMPTMTRDKAIVNEFATKMRNFALGDYAAKRNWNEWLAMLMPYSYWYTFTAKNWLERLARRPSFLSNYSRYKAALQDMNLRYWRERTGDPNAKLPPAYEGAWLIDLPWANTQLQYYPERMLNPLNSWVESIRSTTKEKAPGGATLQAIQDIGPTIFTPWMIGYALWLENQGYKDAAREFFSGPLMSGSRLLRSATAGIKEALPEGAVKNLIPAGGWMPEQTLLQGVSTLTRGIRNAIPETQSYIPERGFFGDWMNTGTVYDERAMPKFLIDLLKTGKLSEEAMQWAGYSHDPATAWGEAAQKQALSKLLPNLASWALGGSFRQYSPTDAEVDQMWADNIAFNARGLRGDAWKAGRAELEAKYPWLDVFLMARSGDPLDRLSSFSWLVMKRLPPGAARTAQLESAGLTDSLVNKFYDSGGHLTEWTKPEQAQWRAGVEQLANSINLPPEQTQADYAAASTIHSKVLTQAATAAGLTRERAQALQDGYYEQAPGEPRAAYLRQNPDYQKYLDAKDAAQLALTPAEQAVHDTYYTPPVERRQIERLTPVFGAAFAEAFATNAQAYYDAGPEGSPERRQWAAQHPAEFGALKIGWEYLRGGGAIERPGASDVGTTWLGTKIGGTPLQRQTQAQVEQRAATPATTPATGAATTPETTTGRPTLSTYSDTEALKRFGPNILGWSSEYGLLDDAAQKQYLITHPDRADALAMYWEFRYGKDSYATNPTYSAAEAVQRFGAGIFALKAEWSTLDDAQKTAFRQQRPQDYTRLQGLWDFYYGPRAATSAASTYRAYSSGGGGGGYRRTPATPVAPVPPVAPPLTPEQLALAVTSDQYQQWVTAATGQDAAFPQLAAALFGPDIAGLATAWFGMDSATRATWAKSNPTAYARLLRYLLWLMQLRLSAGGAGRALGSMPPRVPIAPPPLSIPSGAPVAPPVPPAV